MKKNAQAVAAPVTPQNLLGFLNQAADQLRKPISIDKASQLLADHFGILEAPELVSLALERSAHFAHMGRKRYITQKALFNGAQFRIQPTEEELQKNILIPGHRFLPVWLSNDIKAINVTDPDGRRCPWIHTQLTFDQAFSYYYLLGHTWMMTFPETVRQPDSDKSLIVPVLDMTAFYRRNNVKANDFLILTVKDPWENQAELRHESRQEALQHLDKVRARDLALEKALIKTIQSHQLTWSVPMQLFHAFARIPPKPSTVPGSPFDQFFKRTSVLSLQEVGLEMAVLPPDTTPFQLALRHCRQTGPKKDVFSDPMDQLFEQLGINFQQTAIQGIIRLYIYHELPFAKLINWIIPWKRLTRDQVAHARTLKVELRKLWNKLHREAGKRPLSPELADLFQQAATLKQRIFTILKQLDLLNIAADELPARPLLQLMEVDDLSDAILQSQDDIKTDLHKLADLHDLLSDLEIHLDNLQEDIMREAIALNE